MGKIRVATLGSEEEQKQKEKAQKKRAEKEAIKAEVKDEAKSEVPEKKGKKKRYKKASESSRTESKRYKENAGLVEQGKIYSLTDALVLLGKMKTVKFDETVELHINTTEKVSGNVVLPHGSGKQTRVAILQPAKDAKAADALITDIQNGMINFDVLVATPDAMPKLARVAKILGPRGLMPNPKSGTVTTNPDQVAKKYADGNMTFKTEAKLPLLHLYVGKLSFGKEKLAENITAVLNAVQSRNIKKATLKSTMSAGIKIQIS